MRPVDIRSVRDIVSQDPQCPPALSWWLSNMPPDTVWMYACPRPDWMTYLMERSGVGKLWVPRAREIARESMMRRKSFVDETPLTTATDTIRRLFWS